MSGEAINSFGIVLSGEVQIVQEDYYGNRSILARIGVGNLFAESFACAQIEALPVSVITTTESDLLLSTAVNSQSHVLLPALFTVA